MKNKNIGKWLLLGSVIFTLLPIASLLLASLLSNLLDCSTAYAGEESCKIGGQFVGDVVYSMFTFGLVSFFSIPLGLFGVITATVILITKKIKNKKQSK